MLRFLLLFNFISPSPHFTPLTSHPFPLSHTPFKPSFYLPYNFQCTLYSGFRLSDVIHRWDDIWGLRCTERIVFPLPKAFNYLLLFLHSRYLPSPLPHHIAKRSSLAWYIGNPSFSVANQRLYYNAHSTQKAMRCSIVCGVLTVNDTQCLRCKSNTRCALI